MISKTKYKPRFFGYYLLEGAVKIVDGIVTILIFLFGYTCDLYPLFCEWNLRKDAEKRRKSLHKTPGDRPKPRNVMYVKDKNKKEPPPPPSPPPKRLIREGVKIGDIKGPDKKEKSK